MTTGFQQWRTRFIEQHHGIEPSAADAWNATQPPQDERSCTCHPDDNPPIPCAKKYAIAECIASAPAQQAGQRRKS